MPHQPPSHDIGRRDAVCAISLAGAGVAIGSLTPTSSANNADRDTECVLNVMRSHRSIRKYSNEPLDEGDLRRAVEAAQMAATSSNIQAYSLLHITDASVRSKLISLTGNQEKVAKSGAFFVVLGDSRRHRVIANLHQRPYDARLEAFLLATIDASLFAQNLVLAFESMGYGTCYIGGLRNQLPMVDELLKLPHGVFPLFGLCVGRPAEQPGLKPRLPFEAVCFRDSYPNDAQVQQSVAEYDETMRRYYGERSGISRGWSEGMAQLFASPSRTQLAEYYTSKGARLE